MSDWNYGNAVHQAHIILGLVSMKIGDLPAAKAHLISAGRCKGSPQLNTFGPDMLLAKQMLEHGERDIVFEYFFLFKNFGGRSFPTSK